MAISGSSSIIVISEAATASGGAAVLSVGNYTDRMTGLKFSTNEHGFAALSCFIPMSLGDSFTFYNGQELADVTIAHNAATVWQGRLEDVSIVNGGVRLGAFGYWRALSDAPYTALWSTTRYDDWREVTPQDSSVYRPDRWQFNTTNQLYIAPRENEYYDITDDRGGLTFAAPNGGSRNIAVVTFDYTVTVPSSTWVARMLSFTDAWGSVTAEWTQTGSGSGSATVTLTSPNPRLVFELFYNSGSETQWTGARTGSAFARITNLRVKSTSSSSVYADEIAGALVAFINGINSTQLQSSTALIESPSVDLQNEIYEDEYPADILTRLAGYGDASGNTWEVGVWEDKYLHFRERGSQGRTWYVDAADLEVDRSMAELYNSAYAVYQEASGRSLRTSTSAASTQVSRYGITRRAAVGVSTTGSAQAGYYRDTFLTDKKDAKPRVGIKVSAIYDAAGGRWPLWAPRSGDTVVIRNLPPTLSSEIDKIRTFRILETEYDADSDTIEITPEAPRPALDVLVARQAAGIK